ncbi:MAG: 50S ribosomal protein L3 N(5)-glutamine methyltransferase [Gammaproteobacteria bacterium]|jgi:ribosomal protein L3 glutamine methyltransferase
MSDNPTVRQMIDTVFQSLQNAELAYGHGTDNAWDEAVALVLLVLHLPFHVDDNTLSRALTDEELKQVLYILDRRISAKIPLAYLVNQAFFAGLSFYVDRRVMVPRSPMAELIECSFQPWIKREDINTILDMCTGSGCIAIACAKKFSQVIVDAVDLSDDALSVAKMNIEQHQVEGQVNLIKSDLFDKLTNKQYDIIISNPPYVSYQEMSALPKEYFHEPDLALRAGDDGLEFVLRILREASDYLTPHGILIVEVGNSQAALEERLPHVPFLWLEFERGGQGVFVLTAAQLKAAQSSFTNLAR